MRGQLPENPNGQRYRKRRLEEITYLVVHHSAVDVDSSAVDIARYHVESQGWPGIGYAFIVHWDGTIDYCQDILTMSYHVASRNNECLGILLTGNFMKHWPTALQLESTRELLTWLKHLLPQTQIKSHYEIALLNYPTACCGKTYPEWKGKII